MSILISRHKIRSVSMIPKQKKLFGFTLIELLAVIATIGILSTLLIIFLNGAKAKARDAKRLHDFYQLRLAMEMYYDDYNDYPRPGFSGVGGTGKMVSTANYYICFLLNQWDSGLGVILQEYMPTIPYPPSAPGPDATNCIWPPGLYLHYFYISYEAGDAINCPDRIGCIEFTGIGGYRLLTTLESNDNHAKNDGGCYENFYEIIGGDYKDLAACP